MDDTIERLLRRARRRLLQQAAERRLVHWLRPGLTLAVVLLGADKLWRLRFEPWWVIGTGLLLVVVAALALGRRRLTTHGAALLLDERLGLDERLSSAVALRESGYDGPLRQPLLSDAEEHAGTVDLRTALPRTWPTETRACLALAAALLILALLPRFDTFRTQTDLATELVARQVGTELVEAAKQAEQKAAKLGNPQVRAQARQLLREALKLRRARLPKDEALRRLDKVQRGLQKEREREAGHPLRFTSRQTRDNLKRMGELGRDVAGGFEDARQQAAQELLKELAKRLRDGKLSEAEKKKAAEELQRTADAMKNSPYHKQAEALEQAAKELEKSCQGGGKSCDQNAAKALEDAAKALQQNPGTESQELLEDLQEQCQNGKDALGNAEELQKQAKEHGGQCPGGLCKPGKGKGDDDPGKAGRSRGPGSTNKAAEPTPDEGSGPQQPYEEGQSPKDDSKQKWERLYAPRRTETMPDDKRVNGQANKGGRFRSEQGQREAPHLGSSRVPYQDVLGDYRGAAEDAMSRGDIPVTQRGRVKRYFDELRQPDGDGAAR